MSYYHFPLRDMLLFGSNVSIMYYMRHSKENPIADTCSIELEVRFLGMEGNTSIVRI